MALSKRVVNLKGLKIGKKKKLFWCWEFVYSQKFIYCNANILGHKLYPVNGTKYYNIIMMYMGHWNFRNKHTGRQGSIANWFS